MSQVRRRSAPSCALHDRDPSNWYRFERKLDVIMAAVMVVAIGALAVLLADQWLTQSSNRIRELFQ